MEKDHTLEFNRIWFLEFKCRWYPKRTLSAILNMVNFIYVHCRSVTNLVTLPCPEYKAYFDFLILLTQVENRILEVLLAILRLPQSDRMRVCALIHLFLTYFISMVENDMHSNIRSFYHRDRLCCCCELGSNVKYGSVCGIG